jgi:hypothetical protein
MNKNLLYSLIVLSVCLSLQPVSADELKGAQGPLNNQMMKLTWYTGYERYLNWNESGKPLFQLLRNELKEKARNRLDDLANALQFGDGKHEND